MAQPTGRLWLIGPALHDDPDTVQETLRTNWAQRLRQVCAFFLVRKKARQRLLGKENPLGSSPQTQARAGAPAKTCAVTLPASVAFSVSYQQHGPRTPRA
jgi:hypothetical protein